jgi:hypothetical protein
MARGFIFDPTEQARLIVGRLLADHALRASVVVQHLDVDESGCRRLHFEFHNLLGGRPWVSETPVRLCRSRHADDRSVPMFCCGGTRMIDSR